MTGPLAAERPTEHEVRTLVTKLLTALGDTQKAVAATLLAGEHLGEPCDSRTCPVAHYLAAGLLAAGMTPDQVHVSAYRVMIAWLGVADNEDDLHVYVDLPRPVWVLIANFDYGSYPELRAS